MSEIEKIIQEVKSLQSSIASAHEAIDDYYRSGIYQMGFGPYTQSNIIASCHKQLNEYKQKLIEFGIDSDTADKICQEAPASGYVYDRCMEFIRKYSA